MAKTAVNEIFLSPDAGSSDSQYSHSTSSPAWVVPIGKRFVGRLILINSSLINDMKGNGSSLIIVSTLINTGIPFILIEFTASAVHPTTVVSLESSVFILKPGTSVRPHIFTSNSFTSYNVPGPTFMLMGFLEDDI